MDSKRCHLSKGEIYKNHGGGSYLCLTSSHEGFSALVMNVYSGWSCRAEGTNMYEDGTIEWDYSKEGKFLESQDLLAIIRKDY